ncbi:MAG: hypothetical protein OEU74_00855 [Gammaproteobacteria bacterium]|nr:hypothetical protein [Gammaproteobacteria bacterium]
MRKYLTQLIAVLGLLALLNISAVAEQALTGRIDFVNLKTGEVVIMDTALYLAPGYTVKNKKGEVISAFSLRKGQSIEYKMENRKIKEIIIVR